MWKFLRLACFGRMCRENQSCIIFHWEPEMKTVIIFYRNFSAWKWIKSDNLPRASLLRIIRPVLRLGGESHDQNPWRGPDKRHSWCSQLISHALFTWFLCSLTWAELWRWGKDDRTLLWSVEVKRPPSQECQLCYFGTKIFIFSFSLSLGFCPFLIWKILKGTASPSEYSVTWHLILIRYFWWVLDFTVLL